MDTVKTVFFIPIKDNDGSYLVEARVDLELELYFQFDGWSFIGYVQGAYKMKDGTKALDDHRAYSIIMNKSLIPELEVTLRKFKSKTMQEAIYLEVQYNVEMRLL